MRWDDLPPGRRPIGGDREVASAASPVEPAERPLVNSLSNCIRSVAIGFGVGELSADEHVGDMPENGDVLPDGERGSQHERNGLLSRTRPAEKK